MAEIESLASQSKKGTCQVAKFNYHLTTTIPELFQDPKTNPSQQAAPILKCKKGMRNMTFYFADHNAEGVSSLDGQAILDSAMKLYITSQCVRVNANSFRKSKEYKVPYLPLYGSFQEIIEFHLIDKNEGGSTVRSKVRARNSSTNRAKEVEDETGGTKQPQKIKVPNNFELYVVHHCHIDPKHQGNHMRWQSFIERYRFVQETQDQEIRHLMHYSLMLSFEEEESMFSYFSSHHKLYDAFLADYFNEVEGSIEHLNKMQGYLMLSKERVDRKLKELNDPSHQESHKRWLKLPSQYYKQFTTLKKHTQSYYNSIHPEPKHSETTLNNLVCRYMHAKEYNYALTLESIMDYLKWEKQISDVYTLQMFADFHKIDFYTYLGQDFEGRTVVLNKAANLKVDQIKDVDQYCLYYIYYLQIWLQRKFAGYTDQYTVIADLQGLSSQNFKLSITKRNVSDCLKYCPERQHKMIVVNVSTFANFLWGILKPLIPKRTISKLSIVGSEKNQILETLTKQMDITVIPEYLGGKNTRTFSDDFVDQDESVPISSH